MSFRRGGGQGEEIAEILALDADELLALAGRVAST